MLFAQRPCCCCFIFAAGFHFHIDTYDAYHAAIFRCTLSFAIAAFSPLFSFDALFIFYAADSDTTIAAASDADPPLIAA